MSINLFTNLAATYGLYHGLPQLKKVYRNMEGCAEGTIGKHVYTFIKNHIQPTSFTGKFYLEGIEKYQWVAHLIFTAVVVSGVIPDMKPAPVYVPLSFLTISLLQSNRPGAYIRNVASRTENRIRCLVVQSAAVEFLDIRNLLFQK